jgi:hypothetical protein
LPWTGWQFKSGAVPAFCKTIGTYLRKARKAEARRRLKEELASSAYRIICALRIAAEGDVVIPRGLLESLVKEEPRADLAWVLLASGIRW